jgi:hypothetical protein
MLHEEVLRSSDFAQPVCKLICFAMPAFSKVSKGD